MIDEVLEDHCPKYIADIFLGHIDVKALLQQHDGAIVLEAVLLGGDLPVYPQVEEPQGPFVEQSLA